MGQNELATSVQELKELRTMAEELQAEITTIEDRIKAEMTARGVEELKVGTFKIRWTKVTSNRFDTTSFKQAYEALYKQFSKVTESKRFSIA